jgi:hypothetical protein
MATAELRLYRIRPGLMAEFAAHFLADVAPARRAHGFEVIGPWIDDAAHEFVWIASYTGESSWDDAVTSYYDSPERRQMGFDPIDYIESIDTRLLDDV